MGNLVNGSNNSGALRLRLTTTCNLLLHSMLGCDFVFGIFCLFDCLFIVTDLQNITSTVIKGFLGISLSTSSYLFSCVSKTQTHNLNCTMISTNWHGSHFYNVWLTSTHYSGFQTALQLPHQLSRIHVPPPVLFFILV